LRKVWGRDTEKALGPEHPELTIQLNNLVLLYQAIGSYAEAARLRTQVEAARLPS
jgi:hypothetical protein